MWHQRNVEERERVREHNHERMERDGIGRTGIGQGRLWLAGGKEQVVEAVGDKGWRWWRCHSNNRGVRGEVYGENVL